MLARATSLSFRRGYAQLANIPPVIPLTDGFLLDRRPGQRETWLNPITLRDGRKIRFEIADAEDFPELGQFMSNILAAETNVGKSLGATYEEFAEPMFDILSVALPARGSLLGWHEDKLACIRCVRHLERNAILRDYGTPSENAKFRLEPDYGEKVRSSHYVHKNAKIVEALLHACESQIGQFLPKNINKMAFGEAVGVHDEFKSQGAGAAISYAAEQLAKKHGCTHVSNVAVARNSAAIAAKKNFDLLFILPFDKFFVDGEPVLANPFDNSPGAHVYLGEI